MNKTPENLYPDCIKQILFPKTDKKPQHTPYPDCIDKILNHPSDKYTPDNMKK